MQVVLKETNPKVLDITYEEVPLDAIKKFTKEQPYCYLLASRSSNGWDLTLRIHHALYDGVSLSLIIRQFQEACNGAAPPPPTTVFSKLLASAYAPSSFESRKAFWTRYLSGTNQHPLTQPSTPPFSKTEIFVPRFFMVNALDTRARKHGLSIQSLFLAVYAKTYATLTSTPSTQDVIIGIYLANRSLPILHIAQAAIPAVNLVPLRVRTPLETDTLDIAAQIQYDVQEISNQTNSSVSLLEVYEWTGAKTDTFVNFLKLPDVETKPESPVDKKSINITSSRGWDERISNITEIPQTTFEIPRAFGNGRVSDAYMVSK